MVRMLPFEVIRYNYKSKWVLRIFKSSAAVQRYTIHSNRHAVLLFVIHSFLLLFTLPFMVILGARISSDSAFALMVLSKYF